MLGKNISAFGIYADQVTLREAVKALKHAGFRNTEVSVLFAEKKGSKDSAYEKHIRTSERAATGDLTGGVIGGTLGWLVGIGALSIPGIGPFVVGGPIVAMLSGIGLGGAVGGFAGALVGVGIPDYEAKRYEGHIRNGGILLSVHCDDTHWVRRAKQTLEHTGATDIVTSS
jgi:hypothetical protein